MRLGALLLIPAALAAQEARRLPWDSAASLPWRAAESLESAPVPGTASTGPLQVLLEPGGTLKVMDGRGIVRFRGGLPGRPLRLWRDGGIPLEGASGRWSFPQRTPLSRGLGALPLGREDFRPGLEGLLWILDDEERILTLLHPATAQVAFLPLPAGSELELVFLPEGLGVRSMAGGRNRCGWSLPWLSLLPQLLQLGTPRTAERPGTALVPFPHG